MLANLQSGGISPVFLNMMVKMGAISGALSTLGGMLSGPAALLGFNVCSNFNNHGHVMLISGAVW